MLPEIQQNICFFLITIFFYILANRSVEAYGSSSFIGSNASFGDGLVVDLLLNRQFMRRQLLDQDRFCLGFLDGTEKDIIKCLSRLERILSKGKSRNVR